MQGKAGKTRIRIRTRAGKAAKDASFAWHLWTIVDEGEAEMQSNRVSKGNRKKRERGVRGGGSEQKATLARKPKKFN